MLIVNYSGLMIAYILQHDVKTQKINIFTDQYLLWSATGMFVVLNMYL